MSFARALARDGATAQRIINLTGVRTFEIAALLWLHFRVRLLLLLRPLACVSLTRRFNCSVTQHLA